MSIIIQYLEKLLLNWSIDDPSNCQTRPPFKVLHPVMKQRLGEGTLLYIGLHTCSSFCMNLTYMQLLASCKQRLVATIYCVASRNPLASDRWFVVSNDDILQLSGPFGTVLALSIQLNIKFNLNST